jgi:hypothetical protein
LGFKFQIKKTVRYTRYGSSELNESLECEICLDKKTISPKSCCGKFICDDCNKASKCPFCNQDPILTRRVTAEEVVSFKHWLN